jgi:hypothetical protein
MSDITELINDGNDIVRSIEDTSGGLPPVISWTSERIPSWCDSFGTYTYTLTTSNDFDGFFSSSYSISTTSP